MFGGARAPAPMSGQNSRAATGMRRASTRVNGAADTLLEVVAAVVRRVATSHKFSATDFEVVLARPLEGTDQRFSLPATLARGAETTRAAAERVAGEMLGMKVIRSHRVCSRSSSNRSRDGQHAIAIVYFVLVDPAVEPSDLNLMKNSYFNLGEAIEEEQRVYDFVRDHRELATTALGWLRQMASTSPPRLDFVMEPQSRRTVRSIVRNPLMQKGLSSSLDMPVFTHNNGYFLSGVLKPENMEGEAGVRHNRPRQSLSDLQGVADLDVHDSMTDYDRAHPSVRRSGVAIDGVIADGEYRPIGAVDDAAAAAPPPAEPIYSQSTKKSTHRAGGAPAIEEEPVTWFSEQYAEITDVLPELGTAGGGGDDDDVEEALNGLRASITTGSFPPSASGSDRRSPGSGLSPDYSQRQSVDIPDGEHPFIDDLNSDFSNPLFNN